MIVGYHEIQILSTLFQGYKINPGSKSALCVEKRRDGDIEMTVAIKLSELGLIKNLESDGPGRAKAVITLNGILEINPDYVHSRMHRILKGLANSGIVMDIVNFLGTDQTHFPMALDFAWDLATSGLIRVHSANLVRNFIFVDLTTVGLSLYQRNNKCLAYKYLLWANRTDMGYGSGTQLFLRN